MSEGAWGELSEKSSAAISCYPNAGLPNPLSATGFDLGPAERVIFVLRAVLGRSGPESTALLCEATSDPWTETHVGGAYRAALCSLASSLVHATSH